MYRSILQRVLREVEGLSADAESDAGLLVRFAKSRDEPAFGELLRRHGPMVWAVCRHLLPVHADAEDAFQATFLALVRSAQSIRDGNAVGGWLHGVAVKIATKARRSAVRRKQREHQSSVPEADRAMPEATWDSLLAAVHEEVQRLPAPLRTAFVLCDLEGVRQPDAATQLGWKPGTLTGRLSRARQLLLQRLESRGLAPLLAGGTAGLGVATASAAVPSSLIDRAMSFAIAGGAVPPAVLKLAREAIPMTLNRAKLAAAAVLVAGGLAAGLGPALFPLVQAQPPGSEAAGPGGFPGAAPPGAAATPGLPGSAPGFPGAGPVGPGAAAGAGEGGSFGMEGMTASQPASPYRYAAKPRTAVAFAALLRNFAGEGWEYIGAIEYSSEELLAAARTPHDLINNFEPGANTMLIFKRVPRMGGRSFGSSTSSGMPSMPMAAPGATPGMGGNFTPGGGVPRSRRSSSGAGEGLPSDRGTPMPGAMPPGGEDPLAAGQPPPAYEVIRLRSGNAVDVAKVLGEVFGNRGGSFRVVAEPTSNSIVVVASQPDLMILNALIEKLEKPGGQTPPKP